MVQKMLSFSQVSHHTIKLLFIILLFPLVQPHGLEVENDCVVKISLSPEVGSIIKVLRAFSVSSMIILLLLVWNKVTFKLSRI